jgi:hypothetical protein
VAPAAAGVLPLQAIKLNVDQGFFFFNFDQGIQTSESQNEDISQTHGTARRQT